ncbi:site-specific DNA-methyltransferase [Pseudoflavonifractor sp. An85]|uniref:site-specific DNA-methyltransferase n=1 Tax=Pseudoflavonifractor sp. An85 TaxID=1965661 RepID=UPI000B38B282|nr:site-specific DNA-methyltransferase [Pseudoflavonifractor sp. An85]OUN21308.1 site-specific DNA-methyltransferase [Pseudoflavonifractor sp. An85]
MTEFINGLSMDIEQTNLDKLRAVFPECVSEGKLDIDKLLALCGEYIENDFEKYKFEWKGKAECLKLAQKRSTGTLRPCPDESVNWDTTQNLYIEGDNLEVLKLLQTAYYRKVKMIYIDPPYNTGNDFVYADDFADPMARYKEVTQQTTKSNPETMGRYHTNWLNMMYPRLRLAANLLQDDGVIFISIDDNEVTNLRKICDEVFGEENFVGCGVWKRRTSSAMDQSKVSTDHEYLLMYHKGKFLPFAGYKKDYKGYSNPDNDPRGPWVAGDLTVGMNADMRPNQYYDLVDPKTGKTYHPSYNRVWSYAPDSMQKLIEEDRIVFPEDTSQRPMKKRFANELKSDTNPFSTWMSDVGLNTEGTRAVYTLFDDKSLFNYAKPISLIKALISQVASGDDIILDFFSGSATTAHAVMQLNAEDGGSRRFILVQLPEVCDEKSEAYKAGYKNICEIGKERIRRAGKKILEENAQVSMEEGKRPLDVGFRVFKLDTSNLKTWDATPIEDEQLDLLYQRMNAMVHRVKPERSDLDMVYEIMLKLGVPLTYSVHAIDVNDKTAYAVGDDYLLLVCLAENVQPEDVEQMTEYAPAKVIISRDSFADDTAMANAYYILRDHQIELKLV